MQVSLYFYLGGTIAARIVTFIVCIVLLVSYINVIRTITANTRALLSPPTDAPRDKTSKNTLPQENQ